MSDKDLYLRSVTDKGETGSPENLRLRSVADKQPAPPLGYPYHRRTLKGVGQPYSGRRGFDETTGHRRGFWP